MKKKNLALILSFGILLNCSNRQKINFIFDNTQGLSNESSIVVNGFVVGEIEDIILLSSSKILVQGEINKDLNIPRDSKFMLEKTNFLGESQIKLFLGESDEFLNAKDTVIGFQNDEPHKLEESLEKLISTGLKILKAHVITKENIKVLKVQKHPNLRDHKRLIIVEVDGKRIDQKAGYSDPGSGCNLNLFEKGDGFVLIDCNGSTFWVSKADGTIKDQPWTWMKELPKNYRGTFIQQSDSDEYQLVQNLNPSLIDVYKYKDPID